MQPKTRSGPKPLAGIIQILIALAALAFGAFAVFEVGGEVKGAAKPFFIVPGLIIVGTAVLPLRAALELFRGGPDARRRVERVQAGCGMPAGAVFLLGLVALGRSIAGGEALTEVLPYVGLLAVTLLLIWVVAPMAAGLRR